MDADIKGVKRVKAVDVKDVKDVKDARAEARVEPQVGLAAQTVGAAQPGPALSDSTQGVNPAFLKDMEARFDAAKDAAVNAEFVLEMTNDSVEYLIGSVMRGAAWKGVSSYPVVKVTDDLAALIDGAEKTEGGVKFTVKGDLLEASFHFISGHEGKGYDEAKRHSEVAAVLVKPFNALNELRKKMREAALELQAAEAGMTVDELMKNIHAQQQG